MFCYEKKFKYSGNQVSSIGSVIITANVYITTMTLNFPLDKKAEIVKSLSEANVPLKEVGLTNISIQTMLHDTANIKKTLEVLARDGFISREFAVEITTNCPNGRGGEMNLNHPLKGKNALLISAASSIFNLNAQLEKVHCPTPRLNCTSLGNSHFLN
ncbi:MULTISPECIES: hypothetical protein [unclassified Legionella]|uniref:hypothetical protein n=1 Tax=unclassified Legionella TaxID=2622702 RepID=UPI0010566D7E|nr:MULTISPECIES: hypothetical protein [unclassified Legionella]MDI9818376.1 hypothetical protein [Legionella sp. PL877]